MAVESSVKLKVSIWRDFVPNRSMLLRLAGEQDHRLLGGDSDLQLEVFSWQMREDHLSGIIDDTARLRLRDLLVDRFDPSRPPSERRFEALREFLDHAAKVLDEGGTEWTGSQDASVDDEDTPYRLNPLLALRSHLEWLYRRTSARVSPPSAHLGRGNNPNRRVNCSRSPSACGDKALMMSNKLWRDRISHTRRLEKPECDRLYGSDVRISVRPDTQSRPSRMRRNWTSLMRP